MSQSLHEGIFPYPVSDYPFRKVMEQALAENELEKLNPDLPLLTRQSDQHTVYHQRFYAAFETLVKPTYEKFIHGYVKDMVGEPFVYQKVPTFRIQLPRNVGTAEFHRDTDYGHAVEEVNLWLPVTKAYETNTVWIAREAEPGPMELNYGQILVFHGSDLHGSYPNTTGQTRVSFDFRVVPRREFKDNANVSVSAKRRFVIGDYWNESN